MTYRNHLSPPVFPYAWASDWGEDRYGLWQAFTYKDVRHAFRWIQPGTFMMGSSENEEDRFDGREDFHHVTIQQGFWLAETTVTQALWKVIMSENPSHFRGDNRPVEQVNRYDIETFIIKINHLHPDLKIRLPWEAEWEYACRTGTQTPFYFGEKNDLNLEKVNYLGEWDGVYLNPDGETKEVKTFSCNAWGLYEMHGNVWEWCKDEWNDSLGNDAVIFSPSLSRVGGDDSVVRGGSWVDSGWMLRSAARDWFGYNASNNFLGFRLALDL